MYLSKLSLIVSVLCLFEIFYQLKPHLAMNNDLFGGPGGYDRWFNTSCHPECSSSVRSILSYSSSTILLLFIIYIYVFVFIYNGLLTYSLILFRCFVI
jgi:hypothetical protein